jgi:NAD(P)H-hydrate epimerase
MLNEQLKLFFQQIKLPLPQSHKGQNGKLLIIGGSDLFHAASKWSLDIASKFVDMVFYSSVPQNNELIKEAKGQFWNGIVVAREEIDNYLIESDCILIGPGMERTVETEQITNHLLAKYSDKKWVIDAGALQMVEPKLLNSNCVVTPHRQELMGLLNKIRDTRYEIRVEQDPQINHDMIKPLAQTGVTILLKGHIDYVYHQEQIIPIEGGNAGMTKGGTGDVLAGLVAALYCQHDALTACVVASDINKKAGDKLYEEVGPYFSASDLVAVIPEVLWSQLQTLR